MFRCELTGKVSSPGEKPVRVVVETRPKVYYKEDKTGALKKVGEGFEIVKEMVVCQEAYQNMKGNNNV